jgi:hypothetical protein
MRKGTQWKGRKCLYKEWNTKHNDKEWRKLKRIVYFDWYKKDIFPFSLEPVTHQKHSKITILIGFQILHSSEWIYLHESIHLSLVDFKLRQTLTKQVHYSLNFRKTGNMSLMITKKDSSNLPKNNKSQFWVRDTWSS